MIGIIVAIDEELNSLLEILEKGKLKVIIGITFYEGFISGKKVVVTKSGVGKVNSARTTQVMIDNYKVDMIINVGVAGSCSRLLNIGDIVIGNKIYQYDFDITAFNHKLGYVPMVGDYIKVNSKELDISREIIEREFDNRVFIGTIASGDKFVADKKEKENIYDDFGALCCEMEGASIAQVCFLSDVPFLVIRSISDTLDENIKDEYNNFLLSSCKVSSNFIKKYIEDYK